MRKPIRPSQNQGGPNRDVLGLTPSEHSTIPGQLRAGRRHLPSGSGKSGRWAPQGEERYGAPATFATIRTLVSADASTAASCDLYGGAGCVSGLLSLLLLRCFAYPPFFHFCNRAVNSLFLWWAGGGAGWRRFCRGPFPSPVHRLAIRSPLQGCFRLQRPQLPLLDKPRSTRRASRKIRNAIIILPPLRAHHVGPKRHPVGRKPSMTNCGNRSKLRSVQNRVARKTIGNYQPVIDDARRKIPTPQLRRASIPPLN